MMMASSSSAAADNQRRALGHPEKTHRGGYIPVGSYSMLRRIEGGGGGCRLSIGRLPWLLEG